MEHVFIINPVAGKGTGAHGLQQQIEGVMTDLGQPYEIYVTQFPGDGEQYTARRCRQHEAACRQAPQSDESKLRFYACGGDGTLNEVANGVAGCSLEQVSITVYPCGTGNDFIKNFSTAAKFTDLRALVFAKDRKIDLLKINQRYAINVCNIGFDAEIAYHMNKFKKLPFVQGSMAYTISIFYCLLKKTWYPFDLEIDGKSMNGDYLLTALANGRYYGGAYQAAPKAEVSDGFIDYIGVLKMSRFKMLSVLRLYKEGLHLDSPKIKDLIQYSKCRQLTLQSKEPVPVSLDGDIIQTSRVHAELVPGIINFAVPMA